MINIFTEHITERLNYVLDFCFSSKGEHYQVFTDTEEWNALPDQHLAYGAQIVPCTLQIHAQGLLFEENHYPGKQISLQKNQLLLDGVADELSLIFYFLSRYEEHQSTTLDEHERFQSGANSLVRLNMHKQPVVDLMVKQVWEKLGLDYQPVTEFFSVLPTFDIDVAWAYKNRSFVRKLGGLLKHGKPIDRLRVFSGNKKDPYDTYDLIKATGTASQKKIENFILLGDWAPYDKNIRWENKNYQTLIKQLDEVGGVGIHPSYGSHLKPAQLNTEVNRLQQIVNRPITKSRQHFLRMRIPETYHALITAGISEDYSMGFADQIGFRAGTSFPFFYFDLQKNKSTQLAITPFCYMDSALKDYLNLSPKKAEAEIEKLHSQIKLVGGVFSFIWHNSSLHNTGEWKGWKPVFDFTTQLETLQQ